jgi:hypothetical protein
MKKWPIWRVRRPTSRKARSRMLVMRMDCHNSGGKS